MFNTVQSDPDISEEFDFLDAVPEPQDYIHCDDDVECYGDLTENEIIEVVRGDLEVDGENAEEGDLEETYVIPSQKEALSALSVLERYCFSKNISISVDEIETEIVKGLIKSAKQKFIPDYFS